VQLSITKFIVSLFTTPRPEDLSPAEEAGREDARRFVGAYLGAFEEEASRLMGEARDRLLGTEEEEAPKRRRIAKS